MIKDCICEYIVSLKQQYDALQEFNNNKDCTPWECLNLNLHSPTSYATNADEPTLFLFWSGVLLWGSFVIAFNHIHRFYKSRPWGYPSINRVTT